MSHDPHEAYPGYSPAQILKDGCRECSRKSGLPDRGIASLDSRRFADAWKRAADWERGSLRDVSAAEVPLLSALWSVQIQLEKRGIAIGELPGALFGEAVNRTLIPAGDR